MPIEPHHAVTVCTPMVGGTARSFQDYKSSLISTFKRMPTMREFAAMENRATGMAGNEKPEDRTVSPEDSARIDALRKRAKAKTESTLSRILDHLTRPMTSADLEPLVGMTRQGIGSHLRAAFEKGLVTRKRSGRTSITVWARVGGPNE